MPHLVKSPNYAAINPNWTEAGFSGRQTQKVLNALWFGDWVDGMDLMANFNTAARTRISNIRARGIEIESRKGKGATYEYRLTADGRQRLNEMIREGKK